MAIDLSNLAGTAYLTFADEFNTLNFNTWNTTHDYAPDGYSADATYFVPSGHSSGIAPWTVSNGALKITAAPANGLPREISSGHLDTKGAFSQTYGYYEARIKFAAEGTVAEGSQTNAAGGGAFWLLQSDGDWPPEIDIVESTNWGWTGTVHTGVGGPSAKADWKNLETLDETFHTYGMNWAPDTITFYINGRKVFETATPSDMHDPMYMLLNLYANPQVNSTALGTMEVDYVRAYKAYVIVEGNISDDVLRGRKSHDLLRGHGGDDALWGNLGNDRLFGGSGRDKLYGGSGRDSMWGDAGDDRLYGGLGDDAIRGGLGADVIEGGQGRDVLSGGSGKDTFVFRSANDSGPTSPKRDTITDFSRQDIIDLARIDANTTRSGNQDFRFIGNNPFTGAAGQLHYHQVESDGKKFTFLEADRNGDAMADFQIAITRHIRITSANLFGDL